MKNENEITLRLLCPPAEFCRQLEARGFRKQKEFQMSDVFLIPAALDTAALSVREILARAVLLRSFHVAGQTAPYHCITFKQKHIAPGGEILSQSAHNCTVADPDQARELLEAMGYRYLMTIEESDTVYEKDGFSLSVKDVKNGNALMEAETCGRPGMDSIPALTARITALQLPLDTGDCFVKKAETALAKLLGRYE